MQGRRSKVRIERRERRSNYDTHNQHKRFVNYHSKKFEQRDEQLKPIYWKNVHRLQDGTGITKEGINLQVGLYQDPNSVINLDVSLFKDASVKGLFGDNTALKTNLEKANGAAVDVANYNTAAGYKAFAAACAGLKVKGDDLILQDDPKYGANKMLTHIDDAIDEISRRTTAIGAAQNRVESAVTAIDVQSQNLTSSLSTLRDTDVAEESSSYIQAQILQQASATLLATANQTPSIALNLI